jgi:hypothetical protein
VEWVVRVEWEAAEAEWAVVEVEWVAKVEWAVENEEVA